MSCAISCGPPHQTCRCVTSFAVGQMRSPRSRAGFSTLGLIAEGLTHCAPPEYASPSMHRITFPCLVALMGCPSPTVYTPQPTIPRTSTGGETLAVRVLQPPAELIVGESVNLVQSEMHTQRARETGFRQHLVASLRSAGFNAMIESDATRMPGTAPQLLEVRVTQVSTDVSSRGGVTFVCTFFAALTAGLSFIPCAGVRNRVAIEYIVEMRVYRTAELAPEAAVINGEPVALLNTSTLAPVITHNGRYRVNGGRSLFRQPAGLEATDWGRALGERAAELVAADIVQHL